MSNPVEKPIKRKGRQFVVAKSARAGHVAVRVELRVADWHGSTLSMQGGVDLTTTDARELATALISAADEADAKVALIQAKEERRKKWRQRQANAGRIKIISVGGLHDFEDNR